MTLNINEFQASMRFGGARSSHFEVRINNPISGTGTFDVPFKCFATEVPSRSITPLPVSYFGRPIKFSSVTQFPDWSVQIYNDEDYLIRNDFEQWQEQINRAVENTRGAGLNPISYKSDANIVLYSKDGRALREYRAVGLFPTEVGPIALDWSNEQIQTFSVTFSMDYWTVDNGTTGVFGNLGL